MIDTTHNENLIEYLTNFAHLPCGIAVAKNDDFYTITQANTAFYKIIGHTKEEFLEKYKNRMSEIVIDNIYEVVEEHTKNENSDFEWDLRILTSKGEVRWIHDFAHYNAETNEFFLIYNDITAEKHLEHRINFRTVLYNCIEALFTVGATNRDKKEAYFDILKELKEFYHGDGAFFYKFGDKTHAIESVYKLLPNDERKFNLNIQITASEGQMEFLQAIATAKSFDKKNVLDEFSKEYELVKSQFSLGYKIENFICATINNAQDDVVAFMCVTNPEYHQDDKELMELLSRFIFMFIEHEQDDEYKEEASKLEDISKTNLVEACVQNFQTIKHSKVRIRETLDTLCTHYDAEFAVALMEKEDGSYSTSHFGGELIPDLTSFQNQGPAIIDRWTKMFGTQPKFASSTDFEAFSNPATQKKLNEEYGIHNFIVAPIQDANGGLIGLLFVNNFKLLHRSRLMVHVVAKNISDYLSKIRMYENNQLEPATRLTNKIATENLISKALDEGKDGTLIIVDIDNFKELNDTLGHQMGDKAILDVAKSLKKLSRTTDVVGRIGGDEFMLFCDGLVSEASINKKASQILEKCNLSYEKDGITAKISASIGVCSVCDNKETFQSLYEKSDYALYRAKKDGKNQYHIFTRK